MKNRSERERAENLLKKLMTEKFHNLGKETDIQIYEAQREPNTVNLKRHRLRNIIIVKIIDKKRILKAAREKQLVMYKGTPTRL